jgi:hypothetical protein
VQATKNFVGQVIRRAYLDCLAIINPQNDNDRALALEFRKGAAKQAGEVAVTAVAAGIAYGAHQAASFFGFVFMHADSIKHFISIAMNNDQLIQIVDVIKYASTSLSDSTSDDPVE